MDENRFATQDMRSKTQENSAFNPDEDAPLHDPKLKRCQGESNKRKKSSLESRKPTKSSRKQKG
jgi:hypothetical protein